jgi:hypothetical protein
MVLINLLQFFFIHIYYLDGDNSKNLLFYGGLAFGAFILIIIIIIIIIIVVCSKKKTLSNSRSSIRSTESYTSVVSNE